MPTKTTAEVAAILGISKRTVQRMVHAHKLNPTAVFPPTGAMLFDANDVDRIAAELSHPTPSVT